MLKVLLYAYASFISLACYSQDTLPAWSSPADIVVEDASKNVTALVATNIEKGRLQLNWDIAGPVPEFFSIERSNNGKDFEVVGVLNQLNKQKSFQWIDDAPPKGKTLYRLRYSFQPGESLYSRTIPVLIAGVMTYKFYPNPVDHILIVRSENPLELQISDATGKVRIAQVRVQGIHTINVSSLEKGIYLIRFTNKLTNVMSQEKLIKN